MIGIKSRLIGSRTHVEKRHLRELVEFTAFAGYDKSNGSVAVGFITMAAKHAAKSVGPGPDFRSRIPVSGSGERWAMRSTMTAPWWQFG